jgi:flagellar basal body P-ring formation protein FlgA
MSAALAFAAVVAASGPALAQEPSSSTVPVAARIIPRGHVLSADDITELPASNGERPAFRRVAAGWVARRLIAAGEPLREPSVTPPVTVLPGDTVDAIKTASGLTLTLKATALQHAAIGDRVAVRVDARRRFEGTLTGPRLVVLR